ncbi:MAG TPA: CBM35 domain-containing protein [Micromonosporaceae bacterium]|nr:CBM35 domain-containing protein [Micromonosporaceae bacterium]
MGNSGDAYLGAHRVARRAIGRASGPPGQQSLLAATGVALILIGVVVFTRHPSQSAQQKAQRGTGPPPAASAPARGPTLPTPGASPGAGSLVGAPERPTAARSWGPVSYEAEAAANTFVSSTHRQRLPGTSGGEIISNLGFGPAVRFNGVGVPEAGRYTVTLHYLSPETRTATIRINDGAAVPVEFAPSTGSARSSERSVVVPLTAGANTLAFGNPRGWAPDLDRIVVAATD